jgi:hypothetical protein
MNGGRGNFGRIQTSPNAFFFSKKRKQKSIYTLINGTEGVLIARVET